MTEGIKNVIAVIDEIENNITEEIDHKVLASKLALSVFEFRRIFAFIVGYPISDYIRYRRLSLAAYELISNPDLKVEKVAEKYGYEPIRYLMIASHYRSPISYSEEIILQCKAVPAITKQYALW